MSRIAWILLLTLALASPARAQVAGPCGGFVTHVWVPQPGLQTGSITIGGGGEIPSGPGSSGSGVHTATPVNGGPSGGGDAALLVVAVIAAAILPVVVYAFDDPAQPDVMQCWEVPEERVALYGGSAGSSLGVSAFLGGRGMLYLGMVGLDGAAEGSTPYGFLDVNGAFLLRIPPKQHIEFSIGLGGRRMIGVPGPLGPWSAQSWFELSLPQRYAPFRWSALEPGLSFDLRPALLLAPGVLDVRLDAAVVFPLGPWASLDIGARAYTFQGKVQGGGLLGFQLSL